MPIDTSTPQGDWLEKLGRALHDRRTGRRWSRTQLESNKVRPGIDLLESYFRGDPPLNSDIHAGWKPYILRYIRMGRLNLADLVVSSTANRMGLRDFRTASAGDELGDAKAREIMRRNGMGIVSREVHENFLALADSYTIVTPPDDTRDHSLITSEHPNQVITAHDPATGETRAALKMFRDEWDSTDFAYLYLPGVVRRAKKKGASAINSARFNLSARSWEWDDDFEQKVPGNQIPVVRFRNRFGVGEFERHLDHLDRINDKIFNEWWISKIQAFRQRAAKNLPDKDEESGEPIDYESIFTASPDHLWRVPADVDFWESTPVDVGPIVNSIQKDLERLAAVTSTPLHTITPDAANGSAEGASLMREEHVFKIEDRLARAGDPWARTLSLAFLFAGDKERADRALIEPLWGPVERHSLSEKGSYAAQVKDILPTEAIWTDALQYPPAEVPNLRLLQGRSLLFQEPGGPPQQGS